MGQAVSFHEVYPSPHIPRCTIVLNYSQAIICQIPYHFQLIPSQSLSRSQRRCPALISQYSRNLSQCRPDLFSKCCVPRIPRSPKKYTRAWQPRAEGIHRSPHLENGAKTPQPHRVRQPSAPEASTPGHPSAQRHQGPNFPPVPI